MHVHDGQVTEPLTVHGAPHILRQALQAAETLFCGAACDGQN